MVSPDQCTEEARERENERLECQHEMRIHHLLLGHCWPLEPECVIEMPASPSCEHVLEYYRKVGWIVTVETKRSVCPWLNPMPHGRWAPVWRFRKPGEDANGKP